MMPLRSLAVGFRKACPQVRHGTRSFLVCSLALQSRSGAGGAYGNGEVDLGKGEGLKFQQRGTKDALNSDVDEYLKTVRKDMYPPGQRQKEGEGENRKDDQEEEARRKRDEQRVWAAKRGDSNASREVGTGEIGRSSTAQALGLGENSKAGKGGGSSGGKSKTPEPQDFWRPSGSE